MSEAARDRARFRHGCQGCVFLGPAARGVYDLYFCSFVGLGGLPTIVARYGEGPGAYHSGLVCIERGEVEPHDDPGDLLAPGLELARARGLV